MNNRFALYLIIICFEYPAVLFGNKVAPTNLGGPGLDLWLFLASNVFNIYSLVYSIRNFEGYKRWLIIILIFLVTGLLFHWFTT